jgi:Arc/MetJ family transcription regulator
MQTHFDIDDELLAQAMTATCTTAQAEAVHASLRKLVAHLLHEQRVKEVFRLQEIERRKAEREGSLDTWQAELAKKGNWPAYLTDSELPASEEAMLYSAMELTGLREQSAVIEEALRFAVQMDRQTQILRRLRGIGWDGNLEEMRASRFPDWDQNSPVENSCANTPAA